MNRILSILITVVVFSPAVSSGCGPAKTLKECNPCEAGYAGQECCLNAEADTCCTKRYDGYWELRKKFDPEYPDGDAPVCEDEGGDEDGDEYGYL